MGKVYRALDKKLKEEVALKLSCYPQKTRMNLLYFERQRKLTRMTFDPERQLA